MEQMNALKIIQHLRNIKLWELCYIYLWKPNENMRLEQRLLTHIFLTEGGVRKLIIYIYIYNIYLIMHLM